MKLLYYGSDNQWLCRRISRGSRIPRNAPMRRPFRRGTPLSIFEFANTMIVTDLLRSATSQVIDGKVAVPYAALEALHCEFRVTIFIVPATRCNTGEFHVKPLHCASRICLGV